MADTPSILKSLFLQSARRTYAQKIRARYNGRLVAHWPLWDASGTVARELVAARHGTYTANETLGQPGIGDGRTSTRFNGSAGGVNVYSAGLNSVFPGNEGAASIWVKPYDSTVLFDGVQRYLFMFNVNSTTRIRIYMQDRNITFNRRVGTISQAQPYTIADNMTGWMRLGISWSVANDYFKIFCNGIPVKFTLNGLAAWSGSLDAGTTLIGGSNSIANIWKGYAAHLMLFNDPTIDHSDLAPTAPVRITILGDSIAAYAEGWSYQFSANFPKPVKLTNRAVPGDDLRDDLAVQVAAASNDAADIIIIEIGTNDNNDGNMTTLQAAAEANLAALQASNPRARIYWINVFPKWTDNTGAVPVDRSNVRAAIAAACAAKGVTCIDTFTDPWIVASDTSDGIHPTTTGHRKIVNDHLRAIIPV